MQTEIGIRELKARLSTYLRRVRAGETIIITDRGKPVGRIVPVRQSIHNQLETLKAAGLISWNGESLPKMEPVARIQGEQTVAGILIEDRE
ncbi:MAG: hypothetical protein AMJ56_12380 [Anaerolineae bacterium SG8_19]|jgi:prevent-host-death family protein|nr:MAG: hypothetical protein AMJ56_12380 [Anaerolineae bacterium SG8_19]